LVLQPGPSVQTAETRDNPDRSPRTSVHSPWKLSPPIEQSGAADVLDVLRITSLQAEERGTGGSEQPGQPASSALPWPGSPSTASGGRDALHSPAPCWNRGGGSTLPTRHSQGRSQGLRWTSSGTTTPRPPARAAPRAPTGSVLPAAGFGPPLCAVLGEGGGSLLVGKSL